MASHGLTHGKRHGPAHGNDMVPRMTKRISRSMGHRIRNHHAAQHRRAVDAAGAAPGLGAMYMRVPCRRLCRSIAVASDATDAYSLGGAIMRGANHTHWYLEVYSRKVIIYNNTGIRKRVPRK